MARGDLPKIKFRTSLARTILIAGGDRLLMISAIAGCGYLAFSIFTAYGLLAGLGVFMVFYLPSVAFLRWLAKVDPMFRQVAMRASFYRKFYRARGRRKTVVFKFKDWA